MTWDFFIDRGELARTFGNPRVVRQFETMQQAVADVEEATSANVAATGALRDATFLTLSPNTELPNEYVLELGEGMAIEAESGVARLTVKAPIITSGHTVRLVASNDAELVLPIGGILATRTNAEVLENKTLASPKLSGLANAANDAAAAAAGVPVGGIYRNASALCVRVA